MALACRATRILEIGTGAGDSTLSLARALPSDGMMITMEIDAARAGRARDRIAAAGHAGQVSVMVGEARRFLHKIAGPFDLIFQNSDPALFEPMHDRLVDLLRPGGILMTDNILGNDEVIPGEVANPRRSREHTAAMVSFNQKLAADPRLHTSFLQVGDGASVSVKL